MYAHHLAWDVLLCRNRDASYHICFFEHKYSDHWITRSGDLGFPNSWSSSLSSSKCDRSDRWIIWLSMLFFKIRPNLLLSLFNRLYVTIFLRVQMWIEMLINSPCWLCHFSMRKEKPYSRKSLGVFPICLNKWFKINYSCHQFANVSFERNSFDDMGHWNGPPWLVPSIMLQVLDILTNCYLSRAHLWGTYCRHSLGWQYSGKVA